MVASLSKLSKLSRVIDNIFWVNLNTKIITLVKDALINFPLQIPSTEEDNIANDKLEQMKSIMTGRTTPKKFSEFQDHYQKNASSLVSGFYTSRWANSHAILVFSLISLTIAIILFSVAAPECVSAGELGQAVGAIVFGIALTFVHCFGLYKLVKPCWQAYQPRNTLNESMLWYEAIQNKEHLTRKHFRITCYAINLVHCKSISIICMSFFAIA